MFDWSVIWSNFAAAGFNACLVMIVYLIAALLLSSFQRNKTFDFLDGAGWAALVLGLLVFGITLISRQWQ